MAGIAGNSRKFLKLTFCFASDMVISKEGVMIENDYCGLAGARRLKQRIEDYWKERGEQVTVKLVDSPFVAAMRSARTDVLSDMVNGMPRRKAKTCDAG